MNKYIKKIINQRDGDDDFIYPDSADPSISEGKLINEISEILNHERFCHEGWIEGYGYQEEAAYFIIELLKQKGYKV